MKYFLIFVITLMSFSCISKKNDQANKTKKQQVCIPGGIVVENDNFKIRFVDNAERFVSLYDRVFGLTHRQKLLLRLHYKIRFT